MFANLHRLTRLTLLVATMGTSAYVMAAAAKPAEAAQAASAVQEPAPSLTELAPHIQWYRGMYSREATGFQFPIPTGFHLAENNDARALEVATGHPDDPDLAAWVTSINVPLTSPQSWVVRVRWRGDGAIVGDLDAKLLEDALAQPAEARLASSGGHFTRFAEAPQLQDHVVAWVEERAPATGKGPIFDCHAVRLARRGFLEFSIIGANEGLRKTCAATLRQFTDQLTFDAAHDYPAQIGTIPKASYSLASLVAQTK